MIDTRGVELYRDHIINSEAIIRDVDGNVRAVAIKKISTNLVSFEKDGIIIALPEFCKFNVAMSVKGKKVYKHFTLKELSEKAIGREISIQNLDLEDSIIKIKSIQSGETGWPTELVSFMEFGLEIFW